MNQPPAQAPKIAPLVFSGETFANKVSITKASFAAVECKHVCFSDDVIFEECTFDDVCDFEGSQFKKSLTFRNCIFNKFLMLRGAKLADRSAFEQCNFQEGLSVAAGTGTVNGQKVENQDIFHIRFEGCTFSGYVTFNNRKFFRSAKFINSTFVDPPHFQNVEFHPGTSFDGSTFNDVNEGDEQRKTRAEAGFRCLSRLMREVGDIERIGLFTAREFRTRRSRRSVRLFEKFMITIYELVSDYGRSTVRPIGFFLSISLLNAILLCLWFPPWEGYHPTGISWFIWQQSVRPFSVFEDGYAPPPILPSGSTSNPMWILASHGFVQSLTLIASVSLLIFAIRRRFG